MIKLYLNNEKLNYKINESKIAEKEKYYLINKECIQFFNEYYCYDKIIEKLKKNKKIKEIIKLNDQQIFDKNLINELIQQKDLDEIKNCIKKIEKDGDISTIYKKEKIIQRIKVNKVVYYNNCILINENIKIKLEHYLKNKINNSVDCLIKKNKIIMIYDHLENNYLINIGNLNKDNIY